jgi:hypothetical protein
LVSVHVGENKWEKMYVKDIMVNVIDKIHDYVEPYIHEVKLNSLRRRRLHTFGKEMSKLKFWMTDTIEERLQIDEYEQPSEDLMNKQQKEINKLLSDKMYEKTKELKI